MEIKWTPDKSSNENHDNAPTKDVESPYLEGSAF